MLILPRSSTSAKAVLQNKEGSQKSGKCELPHRLARHQQLQTEMSWRDKLHVAHSEAELKIFIELQRRGLSNYIAPLDTVILIFDDHFRMMAKEKVPRVLVEQAETYTIPDFILLPPKAKPIPVYIDGKPVHDRDGARRRDERITALLRRFELEPMRFRYRPRLSKKECAWICDEIQELCNRNGNRMD